MLLTNRFAGVAGGVSLLLLSGCASYDGRPLPGAPDLGPLPAHLPGTVTPPPLPDVRSHVFDARDGLDITETAILAVINNPDLKASRAQLGVGRAELFAAGLLPDPQLSASLDHPSPAGAGLVNAFSAGVSEDINAIVTRGWARRAKAAALRQLNLQVLWQEWQVAEKARQLFVRYQAEARVEALESAAERLAQKRYGAAQEALKDGNVTLSQVAGDLATLSNVQGMLRTVRRQHQQTASALTALLGLRPGTALHLVGWLDGPDPTRAGLDTALRALPARRPDLLALQAGYRSQDAAYRKAVMAQFPMLNVGLTRARDTSDINTVGVGVTLSLPFLNGNRGNIAIAKATREQLRQAYQARLDTAAGEVWRLWGAWRQATAQAAEVRAQLPVLAATTAHARAAFIQGNLDGGTYVALATALTERRVEAENLRETAAEARIALATVLGLPGAGAEGIPTGGTGTATRAGTAQ